jgi:hypothetical protein
MAEVCLEGRRDLVRRGKMPPSPHDFALRDMAFNMSDCFALVRHEPATEKSRFLFFPGCQLGGSSPEHVEEVYGHLRAHLGGGVGLMLQCCGAPAYWAGRNDLFQEVLAKLKTDWQNVGRPRMIFACPTCYKMVKEHLQDIEIVSLWELLDEVGLTALPQPSRYMTVAVHDPCTARYEEPMQKSIRRLLHRSGCAVEELKLSGRKTECCGYGGLMSAANPSLAADVAKRRIGEVVHDIVTYCAMCRDALAAADKRVLHVLDILFAASGADPAGRRPCGRSERRENRYRLKERLVRTLWGGGQRSMEAYESIQLDIPNEVAECMEERRILREDVQKVIYHAETGRDRFVNPESGRSLASFTLGHVTYWVEYSYEGSAWKVHNAYSHRMEIGDSSGLKVWGSE